MANDAGIPNLVPNLNRIIFDNLLARKRSKLRKIKIWSVFDRFLTKRGSNLVDLNFDTRFGMLASFAIS